MLEFCFDQLQHIIIYSPKKTWDLKWFSFSEIGTHTHNDLSNKFKSIMAHQTSQCRSTWLCGLRRRSETARLLGSQVRIPRRAWVFFCCVSYLWRRSGLADYSCKAVLSDVCVCVCVYVCDIERVGFCATVEETSLYVTSAGYFGLKSRPGKKLL
jgi:hypothetical protein